MTLSWWQGGHSPRGSTRPRRRWDPRTLPTGSSWHRAVRHVPASPPVHEHALFPGEFTAAPLLCPSCSASAKRNSWVKDDGEVRNSNKRNPDAFLAVQKDTDRGSRQAPRVWLRARPGAGCTIRWCRARAALPPVPQSTARAFVLISVLPRGWGGLCHAAVCGAVLAARIRSAV